MDAALRSLNIPADRLTLINEVLSDPQQEIVSDFYQIVAKYGSIEDINDRQKESRNLNSLLKKVELKQPGYLKDLDWLINQRDNKAFITIKEYREKILGDKAKSTIFQDQYAITLEVSALQYFPWIRKMCEYAISNRELVPGRFIAVRKMKEAESDGDLPAILAAMDIIGASFVETLDTKGTDGSNPHLGGPATITGYFGGIGQPNRHGLDWVDEFLYYYTNYGVCDVLNFNAGTILLGLFLYKIGVNIRFKISVYSGVDNPYNALWIMIAARLFCRDDGSTPIIGLNWSNSVNNKTIETTAGFRKNLGFEEAIRFEHHIIEAWKSIVIQPYNRREELLDIAGRVMNISAKHEGGDPDIEKDCVHPSDILDYFRDKEEIIASGDWDYLRNNFMNKLIACNNTARALTEKGLSFIAATNLHK